MDDTRMRVVFGGIGRISIVSWRYHVPVPIPFAVGLVGGARSR